MFYLLTLVLCALCVTSAPIPCGNDTDCENAFSCAQDCIDGFCAVAPGNEVAANENCNDNWIGLTWDSTCFDRFQFVCDPTQPTHPLALVAPTFFGQWYTPPTIGCYAPPSAYAPLGTPCNHIDEQGPLYYQHEQGICQGADEGYCLPNNQVDDVGKSSEADAEERVERLFNVDESAVDQLNEGGFPLLVEDDASVNDMHIKQHGLPLEWHDLVTEPWIHGDDEEVYDPANPLIPTYPIDPRLVDWDPNNDQSYYDSLYSGGYFDCRVPRLTGPDGAWLPFCSGEANNTWWPQITGVFKRPSSFDYHISNIDNGGTQENYLLDNADGFCSPACRCARVLRNGEWVGQAVACNPGFMPVAGDNGDKVARNIAVIVFSILSFVAILFIVFYAASAWSAAASRRLSIGNIRGVQSQSV